MSSKNPLAQSLRLLDDKYEAFVAELAKDLSRRHPTVLGERSELPVAGVRAAFESFVAQAESGRSAVDADVLALSDSIMKVFAHVVGRAAWKPAMALAWHGAMAGSGEVLLNRLRELDEL